MFMGKSLLCSGPRFLYLQSEEVELDLQFSAKYILESLAEAFQKHQLLGSHLRPIGSEPPRGKSPGLVRV